MNFIKIESCIDLSPDYTVVILNISKTVMLTEPPYEYIIKITHWKIYQSIITSETKNHKKILTGEKLKNAVEELKIIIYRAANKAQPESKGSLLKNNTYPKNIKDKIKEKRRLS